MEKKSLKNFTLKSIKNLHKNTRNMSLNPLFLLGNYLKILYRNFTLLDQKVLGKNQKKKIFSHIKSTWKYLYRKSTYVLEKIFIKKTSTSALKILEGISIKIYRWMVWKSFKKFRKTQCFEFKCSWKKCLPKIPN